MVLNSRWNSRHPSCSQNELCSKLKRAWWWVESTPWSIFFSSRFWYLNFSGMLNPTNWKKTSGIRFECFRNKWCLPSINRRYLAVYEPDYFDSADQSHNCEAYPWHYALLPFFRHWICGYALLGCMQPSKREKHSVTFLTGILSSELWCSEGNLQKGIQLRQVQQTQGRV